MNTWIWTNTWTILANAFDRSVHTFNGVYVACEAIANLAASAANRCRHFSNGFQFRIRWRTWEPVFFVMRRFSITQAHNHLHFLQIRRQNAFFFRNLNSKYFTQRTTSIDCTLCPAQSHTIWITFLQFRIVAYLSFEHVDLRNNSWLVINFYRFVDLNIPMM